MNPGYIDPPGCPSIPRIVNRNPFLVFEEARIRVRIDRYRVGRGSGKCDVAIVDWACADISPVRIIEHVEVKIGCISDVVLRINRDDRIAHALPGDSIASYRSAVGRLIELHEALIPGEATITRPGVLGRVAVKSIARD